MVKIRKKKGDQAQMGKVIKQLGVGIYVADLDEVPALCHVNQMATSVAEDNSSRPEDKAKASILPNPASVPNFSKPTSVPDMSYPTSVPNMSNPTSVRNSLILLVYQICLDQTSLCQIMGQSKIRLLNKAQG